ncbi:MAG TPA: hypothetical protein VEZ47_05905 [Gemmatirosa sp.]|nr:hypothetical protein [Gemmatirosa sp.]
MPAPARFCPTLARLVGAAVLALAASLPGRPAAAQRRPLPEFTRQGLLVLTFRVDSGADARLGRQVGDEVRVRMERYADGREVEVLGGAEVRKRLNEAGYAQEDVFAGQTYETISRALRADEYVVGAVRRDARGLHLTGELRLVRNRWSRQPLPPVSHPSLVDATEAFARNVVAARAQLSHERRCENALREGRTPEALEAARAGIAATANGAFVRACQVRALGAAGAPADERLAAARLLLTVDPTSRAGHEAAARALDLRRERAEAARHWVAVVRTDSTDAELVMRVANAMAEQGNAVVAESLVVAAGQLHEENRELLQLRWLLARQNRHWPLAVTSGEALLAGDSALAGDSIFVRRLAEAHREHGTVLRAVELAAGGAARFRGDAALYVTYAQLVLAERDTVVPRGVARFPRSAPLLVLAARELKARGQAEQALAATREAVTIDSTLPQGLLSIAQAEYELGRPDSALVTLARALRSGDDTATVVQFALAKGNALFRAANQTRGRDDFARALRYFALADTVRATPQSRFLLGTAALSLARAELADASALLSQQAAGSPTRGRRPSPAESTPADGAALGAACELTRRGGTSLAAAQRGLEGGRAVAAEAATQYLGFVAELATAAAQLEPRACGALPSGAGGVQSTIASPAAVDAAATPTGSGVPTAAPAATPAHGAVSPPPARPEGAGEPPPASERPLAR